MDHRAPVRLFSSFPASIWGGNVAGVVYDDYGLSSEQMQRLACDLAVPTTGFVRQSDDITFEVRFFSSRFEMDMCGHATIAVFAALFDDKRIDPKKSTNFFQVTATGRLPIDIIPTGETVFVTMRQNLPRFDTTKVDEEHLLRLLGVRTAEIVSIGSASTALNHVFVELRDEGCLASIAPDDAQLRTYCRQQRIDSIGVWCEKKDSELSVRLRDLCHGVGDTEEAASGTTNGALSCHLWRLGRLKKLSENVISVSAEQGVEMGRPSRIVTRLTIEGDRILDVKVGGTAILRLTGQVIVPGTAIPIAR